MAFKCLETLICFWAIVWNEFFMKCFIGIWWSSKVIPGGKYELWHFQSNFHWIFPFLPYISPQKAFLPSNFDFELELVLSKSRGIGILAEKLAENFVISKNYPQNSNYTLFCQEISENSQNYFLSGNFLHISEPLHQMIAIKQNWQSNQLIKPNWMQATTMTFGKNLEVITGLIQILEDGYFYI